MNFKKYISKKINVNFALCEELEKLFVIGQEDKGDFCLPCFKFAKALKISPVMAADKIIQSISDKSGVLKIENVNGYVNFYIDYSVFSKDLIFEIIENGENYGQRDFNNKTICIDYSSINIAKPFHIGHLSTTVIGGALYKIYKFLGYNVIGINHLGDYGTQFGKLICAFKRWGNKKDVEVGKIKELFRLYVKFHDEAKKDVSLEDEARTYFKKIENNDTECVKLFEFFKTITLKEVEKVYKLLDVTFDSYNGESFYNDKMQGIIDDLKVKNLLQYHDGAHIVDLEKYNLPPCLILKADGASLYATRDLAAADYRYKTYKFDKNLYVVAYQQNLHFQQVFKVLELMGKSYAGSCEHIAFGMVSLEGSGSMSSRDGNVVFLEDVINKSVEKALKIIEEKNPQLDGKIDTANIVGVGAVIFSALINNRIKDIVFSYDKILNFDGETCPYVQYTYARCSSVMKKSKINFENAVFENLEPQEILLIKQLSHFKQILNDVANKNEPSILTRYVVDICKIYNKFYFDLRIITGNPDITKKRVALTKATMIIIKNGLRLLGIKTADRM